LSLVVTGALPSPVAGTDARMRRGASHSWCRSSVEALAETPDEVVLKFDFDPGTDPVRRTGAAVLPAATIPKVEYAGTDGERVWRATSPDPCAFSVLVRVPDLGAIESSVSEVKLERDADKGQAGLVTPADGRSLVTVSEPAVLRDLRVVRVTFLPFLQGAKDEDVVTGLTLLIRSSGSAGVNEKRHHHARQSAAFERLVRSKVINHDAGEPGRGAREGALSQGSLTPSTRPTGAQYLVIVPDAYREAIEPLVAWKAEKGILCKVATLSETGSAAADIRAYIENAYYEWEIPPEFVLLVGDVGTIPAHQGLITTDNYYAAIEGSDYLADILVGRFPAENGTEVRSMVAKTLAYERPWTIGSAEWPTSAALLVRDDDDPSDDVYYGNTWFIHGLMEDAGFSPIDTLFAKHGITEDDVYASINAGKGFVNFRGVSGGFWVPPFMIMPWSLENGWEVPIVVSATCLTGALDDPWSVGMHWLKVGTEADPRGGAAFFGTGTSGSGLDLSIKRGLVDEGFFANAFGVGRTLGEACAAGKLALFEQTSDQQEYEGWNLQGDPELPIWTARPALLTVEHNPAVTVGPTELAVAVTVDGAPSAGAFAAVSRQPDIYVFAETDADGRAVLPLNVASPCTLRLTVTARNARPYAGDVLVIPAGAYVDVRAFAWSDSVGGNGDGLVTPGETLTATLALVNLGNESATGVEAALRLADPRVSLADSLASYGDIESDSTAWGDHPYILHVSEDWPVGHALPLSVAIHYGDTTRVVPLPALPSAAGLLAVSDSRCDDAWPGGDGNGRADPGEDVAIAVGLANAGRDGMTRVSGTLLSSDPYVIVTSPFAAFSDVAPDSTTWNDEEPFVVSISPLAPPDHAARLRLFVEGSAPAYAYAETLNLGLTLFQAPAFVPSGPDDYGYYACDSTDTLFAQAPRFDWVEIAPPGPGIRIADLSDNDDRTRLIAPSFVFRYYGADTFWTSVCTNGFVSLENTSLTTPQNSGIPNAQGPPSMLAPFWDDLNPAANGDIYVWHDTDQHRFVVEFDDVRRKDTADTETFQVLLFDPAHYSTPTGDGLILFQYRQVSQPGSATVGIESPSHDDGIEYGFNGSWDRYAAPLRDSMAVLFTTTPPEHRPVPWLVLRGCDLDDSGGGDGDGRLEAGETASLGVEVSNGGTLDAAGVALALSSRDSLITIVDSLSMLPDIPAGSTVSSGADRFALSASDGAAGSVATLWFRMEAGSAVSQRALRLDLRIGPLSEEPGSLALTPCFPNPFAGGTAMLVTLPRSQHVRISIHDVAGRLVRTVLDGPKDAGTHHIAWDGTDARGRNVASGVYFVRLEAGGAIRLRKVVLVR
jgi:hypothetical protein